MDKNTGRPAEATAPEETAASAPLPFAEDPWDGLYDLPAGMTLSYGARSCSAELWDGDEVDWEKAKKPAEK